MTIKSLPKRNLRKNSLIIIFILLTNLLEAHSLSKANLDFVINREYKLDTRYFTQLLDFSHEYNIELLYLQNWIMAESSGRERAYNKKTKDYGLVQLHDVDYLIYKYWKSSEAFNIWNGNHNLQVGLSYLGDLINEFGIELGFMAYNIGPTRVRNGRILKVGEVYVKRIFEISEEKEISEKKETIVLQGYPFFLDLLFYHQDLFDDRKWNIARYLPNSSRNTRSLGGTI